MSEERGGSVFYFRKKRERDIGQIKFEKKGDLHWHSFFSDIWTSEGGGEISHVGSERVILCRYHQQLIGRKGERLKSL